MKTIVTLSILLLGALSFGKVENVGDLVQQSAEEQTVASRNLDRYFGFSHRVMVAKKSKAADRFPSGESNFKIRLVSRK